MHVYVFHVYETYTLLFGFLCFFVCLYVFLCFYMLLCMLYNFFVFSSFFVCVLERELGCVCLYVYLYVCQGV